MSGADVAGDCPAAGGAQCSTVSSIELLSMITVLVLSVGYLLSQLRLPKAMEAWSIIIKGEMTVLPIPKEAVVATRIWSGCLLMGSGTLLYMDTKLSIPLQCIIGILCISGLFIEHPLSQSLFHISSSCGWFALFDAFLYANLEDHLLGLVLSSRGLLCAFMISGPILRMHHGNQWQYTDPSHALLGYLSILSFFWVVELPLCSAFATDTMCAYLGQASSMHLHNSAFSRFLEVIKMGVIHAALNGVVYMNRQNSTCDVTINGDDRGTTIPPLESTQPSNHKETDLSEGDLSRRFSGATDTEDDNHTQCITDESGQQRKLPSDCVEITEAEAIEIIQNGLNNFKKKRAT